MSLRRIRTWNRRRTVFLVLTVLAFAVTETGRHAVRPWVRANGVNDLGLTDSIGNLGGIMVQIFLYQAVANPRRRRALVLALVFIAGYIVYEFAQPHLPRGTFDPHDIVATLVGGAVALAATVLVWRRWPERPSP